jgi:hypothetical protein
MRAGGLIGRVSGDALTNSHLRLMQMFEWTKAIHHAINNVRASPVMFPKARPKKRGIVFGVHRYPAPKTWSLNCFRV